MSPTEETRLAWLERKIEELEAIDPSALPIEHQLAYTRTCQIVRDEIRRCMEGLPPSGTTS